MWIRCEGEVRGARCARGSLPTVAGMRKENKCVNNLLVEVRDRGIYVRRSFVRGREDALTESEVGARVRRLKKVKGHRSSEGRR